MKMQIAFTPINFLLVLSVTASFTLARGFVQNSYNQPPATSKRSIRNDLLVEEDTNEATITEELQAKIKNIRAIASDVDGTLLGTDHMLSETTKNILKRVVQQVVKENPKKCFFFPATGKSRKGALDSLGTEIKEMLSNLPGVFIQGLYCVDGDGNVIYERSLPPKAIKAAEEMARKFNITVIGNFRDEIYCNLSGEPDVLAEVNGKWGEPHPIMIDSLSESGITFNKLVFTGKTEDIEMLRDEMRPELEQLANTVDATVTTSFPTILELLPGGCSKADGVQQMCKHLGIDPETELLALGDQENDTGMLKMAAIGVSVGNGSPLAKEAADYVMEMTSNEGAAGLAMNRFAGFMQQQQQQESTAS